jgi:hypothetical protein
MGDERSAQLAEDQVWQVNGAYAHIVTVGKRLVHYKMAKSLIGRAAKAAPVRVGTCEALLSFRSIVGRKRIEGRLRVHVSRFVLVEPEKDACFADFDFHTQLRSQS